MSLARSYDSSGRARSADATRGRVLSAARTLFSRNGIDGTTIAQIAARANVAESTVYALFKSKDGLLQALMRAALFGPGFQTAQSLMDGVTDGRALLRLTARVAGAIYEGERKELGSLRGASGSSPALKRIEQRFEKVRFDMQEARLRLLFEQGQAKRGLDFDEARRLLWMYTSRDVHRMLVVDGKWPLERYESWLAETLLRELSEP